MVTGNEMPLHDGTDFDLESKQPRRHPEFPDPDKNLQNYTISSLWMYDWMQELKDFHNWKKAVRDDDDVHVFAFRESKIYILKRLRARLHRIQTTMV